MNRARNRVFKKSAFSEVRTNNFLVESTGTSQFVNLKQRVKDIVEKHHLYRPTTHERRGRNSNMDPPSRGNSDLSHLPGCTRFSNDKKLHESLQGTLFQPSRTQLVFPPRCRTRQGAPRRRIINFEEIETPPIRTASFDMP